MRCCEEVRQCLAGLRERDRPFLGYEDVRRWLADREKETIRRWDMRKSGDSSRDCKKDAVRYCDTAMARMSARERLRALD